MFSQVLRLPLLYYSRLCSYTISESKASCGKARGVRMILRQGADIVDYEAYSCFEKGCPTKPYATMPKGIMGNGVHGP